MLAERAPERKRLSRDEASAELARRYFASHGPATLQDFSWWSGLPAGDVKMSLETAGADIVSGKAGSWTYWFSRSASPLETGKECVYLLPAFDEFIISYKDRSPSIPTEHNGRAISSNGVFRPVIVVNGQVVGLWKRTVKKDKVVVGIDLFRAQSRKVNGLIEKEVAAYGLFLNRKAEMSSF